MRHDKRTIAIVAQFKRRTVTQKRRSRVKFTPVETGNDPALWRHASLADALKANVHLIAHLIALGEERTASQPSEDTHQTSSRGAA